MDKLPKRKSPRKKGYDYSLGGAYFITICTLNKKKILSKITREINNYEPKVELTRIGKQIEECLGNIKTIYGNYEVGDYIIMPNHIHFIVYSYSNDNEIYSLIKKIKTYTTHLYGSKLWQRSFYDHIIRNEKDFEQISKYIHDNPARWIYDDLN